MAQTLVSARAAVDGSWVLPPPLPPAAAPAASALPVCSPDPLLPDPPRETIWIAPEQARRSLVTLVRAAAQGAEVVLTRRGWPAARLVPATNARDRLGRLTGRTPPAA